MNPKQKIKEMRLAAFLLILFFTIHQSTNTHGQITWNLQNPPGSHFWRSVTYGNGIYVAVPFSSANAMTSPDGINWTIQTTVASENWTAITYGNGLFVAVNQSGVVTNIMTSPDGITWTARTAPANYDWQSVTYGNSLFVAVASTGTGDRVMTSPDGINWTIRNSAADNAWWSVTYANNLFVAVAQTGTGDRVMTSPDGINWTIRTSAADNQWSAVTYGNGLFVAVALTGTGDGVMTSPDGINWTARTPAADYLWEGVTYGNGFFVAVSRSGTGDRVMTSQDGINWTSQSSAADDSWFDIVYANDLFVAVSANGNGMTSEASNLGLEFDGTDDYVNLGDIDALDGLSAHTIECWVKLDAHDNYDRIVIKEQVSVTDNGWGIGFGDSGSELRLFARGGVNAFGDTPTNTIPLNTWTHVAYVFDGSGAANSDRLKCYVNGSAVSLTYTGTVPASFSSNAEPVIIAATSDLSQFDLFLDGQVDEVRLWDIALTASQINSLYNDTFSDPTTPSGCLKAYYQMTDASGSSLTDDSGNGNTGTFAGNPSWAISAAGVSVTTAPTCASLSLPVELIAFKARKNDETIQLTWQTASEINNEGFEIEWSVNNRDWENIGFVTGSGDSYEVMNYQFIHKEAKSGINYYRLKQMDFDGEYEYSDIVNVDFISNDNRVEIYPNPIQDGSFTLYIPQDDAEITEMTMYDLTGRVVIQKTFSNARTVIDVNDFEKGLYLIKVETDGISTWEKIMIQRI